MHKFIIVAVLCVGNICVGSRVLVVSPMLSGSHIILTDSLVNTLLNAGHEVTYVATSTKVPNSERLTYVNISSVADAVTNRERLKLIDLIQNSYPPQRVLRIGSAFAKRVLQHEAMQDLLRDTDDAYDVVVAEWFYSGLLAPLASLYACPLIWYSALDATWLNLQLMHEQSSPAYTVDLQAKNMVPWPDTVGERMYRLWRQAYMTAWTYYMTHYVEAPAYLEIYQPLMQLRQLTPPDYVTLVYNGTFLLLNSHPLLGHPMTLPENAKYVGGHHIEVPTKPLPKNLQQLLDTAKNGVILFSMGTNMNSKDFPEKMKRELIQIFGQLEQTVIWKIGEKLENLPRNIYTMDWVPQTSILNHSNTVLLISHGGFISFIEAAYFGVPVIAIPFYGDQFIVTDLAAARGRGIRVDFTDKLPYKIKEAINEILGNYSYRSNAKEASSIFQRNLVPSQQELLHWIELVINTRGVPYLRSPAVKMSTVQRLYLDILAIMLMFVWLISKVVKVIRVHLKSSSEEDKRENKKDK